jgi:hypothetical protein
MICGGDDDACGTTALIEGEPSRFPVASDYAATALASSHWHFFQCFGGGMFFASDPAAKIGHSQPPPALPAFVTFTGAKLFPRYCPTKALDRRKLQKT